VDAGAIVKHIALLGDRNERLVTHQELIHGFVAAL
jgi:hypothetical protein